MANSGSVVHGLVDELLDRMRALDGLNEPHLVLGRILAQAYDMSAFKIAADDAAASRTAPTCCSTRSSSTSRRPTTVASTR